MDHVANPKLTSGELGNLWEQYMSHSAVAVVLEHFQQHISCEDIKSICTRTLEMANNQKNILKELFNKENYPLPTGFSAKDDLIQAAPKIMTDEFILFFLNNLSKVDLALTSLCLGDAARQDIRKLYSDHIETAKVLYEQSTSLLLDKGLFVRPPIITSTHEAKPMAEKGFLSSFFGQVNERPLTAREANELHKSIFLNHLGKSALMAFHQTSRNPELKALLLRGKELASKVMKEFSQVLIENDLPVAMSSDTHVLDSTQSPFSDRLISFLVDEMNKFGLANYGYGAAVSSRKDLMTLYARIIADAYQYRDDVKKFMIENHWLEKPPVALDRLGLAHA